MNSFPIAAKGSAVGVRHVDDIRDDMLSCKVCLGQYNSSSRRPRALHCQHTFCERCIHDCLLKRNKVVCPLCPVKTRFANQHDGVQCLPVNVTAIGMTKQQRQTHQWAGSCAEDGTLHELHKVVAKKLVRLHPPPNGELSSATPVPQPETRSGHQKTNKGDVVPSKGRITFLLPSDPRNDNFGQHTRDVSAESCHEVIPSGSILSAGTKTVQKNIAQYAGRFGKYYDASVEHGGQAYKPGAFLSPSYVACLPATHQSRGSNGRVVVVDRATSTIQLFTGTGDFLSVFHKAGARAACFVITADGIDLVERCRVAVAADDGVSLFDQLGRPEKTIPIIDVVGMASYEQGFVAAHRNRLSLCHRLKPTATMSTVSSFVDPKSRTSVNGQFRSIVDVVVCNTPDRGPTLYVLDVDVVYLVDPTSTVLRGIVQLATVDPTIGVTMMSLHPVSIAVDDNTGFVLVSDSNARRVNMYECSYDGDLGKGTPARCLVQLGFDGGSAAISGIGTCGPIAVGIGGLLYVVVSGSGLAEVRMFNM